MIPLEKILDKSKDTFFGNLIYALRLYFSEFKEIFSFYDLSDYENFLNFRRKRT